MLLAYYTTIKADATSIMHIFFNLSGQDLIIRKIKRFFAGLWHRKKHAVSTRFTKSAAEYILDTFSLCAWLYLILSSKDNTSYPVIISALVMLFARAFPVGKALWKGDSEKLNFLKKRRIESNTCLMEINRCLVNRKHATPEKIKEIRLRLLRCIVDSVRAYRNDVHGNKIFSNLLIPEGDDLIVAIRNAPDRSDGTRYSKESLHCSEVLQTKKPTFLGNLDHIDSNKKREVKYKSFMAIPVLSFTGNECLAIVTIDSTEVHHFDEVYETFDTLLSPYITSITTTFIIENEIIKTGGSNG